MPIKLISERRQGLSPCLITEVAEGNAPGLWEDITSQLLCDGSYTLQFPDRTKLLKINPYDGHWSMVVSIDSPDEDVHLISMGDTDLPWWQRLVGAKRPAAHSARGIRVGIIDLLFNPGRELAHVKFIDPRRLARWQTSILSDGHGQQVSAVLATQGPGGYRGLAYDADTFFVDASVPDDNGTLSPTEVDHARVRDGVINLSRNYNVDIINLSCGFDDKNLPDLQEAIEEAADLGTICICAAGNSGGAPVEVPAKYETAVAVGGIGFTKVARQPTCLGHNAEQAMQDDALGTFVSTLFGRPFHDTQTSFGPEINVLAPSMGIAIKSSAGTISDCFGTSYAAPIAGAVLACALANDRLYRELKGRDRHVHARHRLGEISVDLGLPLEGVQAGLPVLRR